MLDAQLSGILLEGLRLLFLVCTPVVLAMALSSFLISALQTALSIQEPVLGYCVRLVTLVFVMYATYPAIENSLRSLADLVYR